MNHTAVDPLSKETGTGQRTLIYNIQRSISAPGIASLPDLSHSFGTLSQNSVATEVGAHALRLNLVPGTTKPPVCFLLDRFLWGNAHSLQWFDSAQHGCTGSQPPELSRALSFLNETFDLSTYKTPLFDPLSLELAGMMNFAAFGARVPVPRGENKPWDVKTGEEKTQPRRSSGVSKKKQICGLESGTANKQRSISCRSKSKGAVVSCKSQLVSASSSVSILQLDTPNGPLASKSFQLSRQTQRLSTDQTQVAAEKLAVLQPTQHYLSEHGLGRAPTCFMPQSIAALESHKAIQYTYWLPPIGVDPRDLCKDTASDSPPQQLGFQNGFPDLRLQKGNILHAPSTTAAPESDLRSSDVPTLISGSTDPATNQDPVGHYIYNSRNHEFRFSNDLPIKDPGETRAVTANLSQAVLASVAEEPSSGGDEYDVEWNAFIYNDAVEESEAQ